MPATNSATTAPMSASPDEMRSPPKKYGAAEGMRSLTSVCQRLALFMRKRLTRPGFTLRRPRMVFEMIGKSATMVAHTTSAVSGCLTQMMMSGAIATIGVTWSSTAYGKRLASIVRLCTKRKAITVPMSTARKNAPKVTFRVMTSEPKRSDQSAMSVWNTIAGAGSTNFEMPKASTTTCQARMKSTPTAIGAPHLSKRFLFTEYWTRRDWLLSAIQTIPWHRRRTFASRETHPCADAARRSALP